MAEAGNSSSKANTAVKHGDHDRVQMLSLRADGTPDQHNPELIGDKESTLEATKEQFKQQAVSAVDSPSTSGSTVVEDAPQDPEIEKATKEHEKAAKAAESAATKVVNDLSK